MTSIGDSLSALVPALAFLLAAVPFAALMERLGFFDAAAEALLHRSPRGVRVGVLWAAAALTTIGLNLDTTIVLLTPLSLRLAKRTGTDPVALALIPLVMASLASSVLPVSNLTTMIAVERTGVGLGEVMSALALPSLAAVVVGWLAYCRHHPTRLPPLEAHQWRRVSRKRLAAGSVISAGVLVGFVVGEQLGIHSWVVLAIADVVLVLITKRLPWRTIPIATALGVAAVAAVVALTVPESVGVWIVERTGPLAHVGLALGGAAAASLVNNLPAVLGGLPAGHSMGPGGWAWLLGVNAGAAFVPMASLANLLWRRILDEQGHPVRWSRYVRLVVPVAGPGFVAAVAVLALTVK